MDRGSRRPRSVTHVALGAVGLLAALWYVSAVRAQEGPEVQSLVGLSLAQLSDVQVTSVSKVAEPLSDADASIFVISHDDIVRSGASTLVEALRLAPNLRITQLGPTNSALSGRGFGGNTAEQSFSNKILMLIDGRSVYSPLYSGVYLDVQDLVLADIDRIEVITGPGSTLWGANAMNGVINVITRSASRTQGTLVQADGGNLQRDLTARYGAALNDSTSLRVYAKAFQQSPMMQPGGLNPHDGWNRQQGGFRADRFNGNDTLTLQGDIYRGTEHALDTTGGLISGGDVLGRWQRDTARAQWQLQAYFDQTERWSQGGIPAFVLRTYDFELQQALSAGARNNLIWGAGERVNSYGFTDSSTLLWVPPVRALTLGDLFAQDTFSMGRVSLTAGLKFEDDPYAGWQFLPDLRISWNATEHTLVWGALSNAVRSPTPFDEDVLELNPAINPIIVLAGSANFRPERLWSSQLGVRSQPIAVFSTSVAVFYNDYSNLRSIEFGAPAPPALISLTWGNQIDAQTYGVEAWADWQALPWWRLSPGVTVLHERFAFEPGVTAISPAIGLSQETDDPSVQVKLTSSMDLGAGLSLNASWRYVGALPSPALPSYDELNANLAWRAMSRLQFSLQGSNLLHARHLEFPQPYGEYIDRSVLLEATYRR